MKNGNALASIDRRTLLKGTATCALVAASAPWSRTAFAACDTLRAGITGYDVINTLDPGKASLIPEFYVLWALFNSLLKFNGNMEIVPDVAQSWRAKDDTTWEFKLRKGVAFHDGSEMTAEDVRFTIERVKREEFGSPHKSKFDVINEIRVPDSHTVEIVTAQPFAPLMSYLTNTRTGSQIVPKRVVERIGDEAFARSPVGSGAFKLVELEPNANVSLAAHDHYFVAGQPVVRNVEMPLISEETSGVTALLGGTIDLTSTAPFADVPDLLDNPKVKVLRSPGLNTRFVQTNHRMAPFDDVHFRRAVSMAFDRQTMVDVVVFGEGSPANGIVPSALSWAHKSQRRPLISFDPERANAELAKSKYGPGTEAIVLTWGAGWWKRFAEVFAAQVNKTLGTKLNVEVSEASTVYSRLKASDFQCSIWGWLGLIDPDEYLYEVLHTKGWRNFAGYSNAAFDKLLEDARGELDQAKRGEMYRRAEDMVAEEAPVIFCFESNVHNLMTPAVKGFVQLPYSAYGGQFAAVSDC